MVDAQHTYIFFTSDVHLQYSGFKIGVKIKLLFPAIVIKIENVSIAVNESSP